MLAATRRLGGVAARAAAPLSSSLLQAIGSKDAMSRPPVLQLQPNSPSLACYKYYHTTPVLLAKPPPKKQKRKPPPKKQKRNPRKIQRNKAKKNLNYKFMTEEYCKKHAWLLEYNNETLKKIGPKGRRRVLKRLNIMRTRRNMKVIKMVRNRIKETLPKGVLDKLGASTAELEAADDDNDDDEDDDDSSDDSDGEEEDKADEDDSDDEELDAPITADNRPIHPFDSGYYNGAGKYDHIINEKFAAENAWFLAYTNQRLLATSEEERLELFDKLGIPFTMNRQYKQLRRIRQKINKMRPKSLKDLDHLHGEAVTLYQNHTHEEIFAMGRALGIRPRGGKAVVCQRLGLAYKKLNPGELDLLQEHEKELKRICRMLAIDTDSAPIVLLRRLERTRQQNRFLLEKSYDVEWVDLHPPNSEEEEDPPSLTLEEFDQLPWMDQVLYYRNRRHVLRLYMQQVKPKTHTQGWKMTKYMLELLGHFGKKKYDFGPKQETEEEGFAV